jgi:hypothetical protein
VIGQNKQCFPIGFQANLSIRGPTPVWSGSHNDLRFDAAGGAKVETTEDCAAASNRVELPHHLFTPLRATPSMNCFCARKKISSSGRMLMKAPA